MTGQVDRSDDRPDDEGVAAALLVAMLEDQGSGGIRTLEAYLARYPGFDHVVRREYESFVNGSEDALDSAEHPPGFATERYHIDGEIGRGGMGIVYRAYEQRLDRVLALKAARGDASTSLSRLIAEARITAQLDHPGIVPVHELGLDGDSGAWFTMPLVRGRTLADVIKSLHEDDTPSYAAEEWRNALDALVRVCDAVAFAHSRSVFHRDLKPQNVMVGPFGEVYVMDWGLAHAGSDADPTAVDDAPRRAVLGLTRVGDVLGTPGYMPPEQLEGTVDALVDVYAIGAMLYHLLAGHMPYAGAGASTSADAVLRALRAGPPQPLAEVAAAAPSELVAICERAMARDPHARYPSAEALRRDLRAHLDGRVVSAHEQGPWAELRKWVGRNRAITAAISAAVLALAIGLVVSLVQTSRADRAAARSRASFVDSVHAVRQMLSRVARSDLESVPQTAALRRDLLIDATDFLERFLVERPDDVPLLREAAVAWYRVADIRSQIGEHDEAAAATRRALELVDRGLELAADDFDLRLTKARVHFQAGNDQCSLGNDEPGIEQLNVAVDLTEGLLAEVPTQAALAAAGTTRDALALASLRRGDLDGAEQHARRSAELWAALVEHHGDAHLGNLGTPHALLAGIYLERGDRDASLEQLRTAEDVRRRRLALDPEDPRARAQLAEVLRNLSGLVYAVAYDESGSPDQESTTAAEALAAEAVGLRRQNVAVADDTAAPRQGLADALLQQARLRRALGDVGSARDLALAAVRTIEVGLSIDHGHVVLRSFVTLAHREVHRCAMTLGDADGALANAAALADCDPGEPKWLLEAACLYAEMGRYLDDPHAAHGTERALTLLRDLAAHGRLPAEALDDPRLDRLRERDGFPRTR